jgi:hypothetical protein
MSTSAGALKARLAALEAGKPSSDPLVIIVRALTRPDEPEPPATMQAQVYGVMLESAADESEADFIDRAKAFELAHRPLTGNAVPLLAFKVPATTGPDESTTNL